MTISLAKSANAALIATAAHIVLSTPSGDDRVMWISLLRDVLRRVAEVPQELIAVKAAAEVLVVAGTARDISNAHTRLRLEVMAYYRAAAAHRVDELRRLTGGRL